MPLKYGEFLSGRGCSVPTIGNSKLKINGVNFCEENDHFHWYLKVTDPEALDEVITITMFNMFIQMRVCVCVCVCQTNATECDIMIGNINMLILDVQKVPRWKSLLHLNQGALSYNFKRSQNM